MDFRADAVDGSDRGPHHEDRLGQVCIQDANGAVGMGFKAELANVVD